MMLCAYLCLIYACAGKFIWPGFGENSRVIKWVFERCAGTVGANETPIGFVPKVRQYIFMYPVIFHRHRKANMAVPLIFVL